MVELREPIESLISFPYCGHLDRLGLAGEDLVAHALVLGREESAP